MARAANTMAAVLLALALAGCEDVRPGQVATELEREAARDLVAQLAAITAQPTDASGILDASSFAPIITLVAPPGTPLAMPGNEVRNLDSSACLIATGTSVTYSQCTIADHVVDGTWSAQLSRIHATLVDVFVVGPGVHGSVAVDANLAHGTELSGTLDTGIMWSVGNGDYVMDASMRIDGLLLDGPRCATAGSIAITGWFGGWLGDAPATTLTLWFGPGSQDISISR